MVVLIIIIQVMIVILEEVEVILKMIAGMRIEINSLFRIHPVEIEVEIKVKISPPLLVFKS